MPAASLRHSINYWSVIALSVLIPIAALLGEGSDIAVPMNAAVLSLALLASSTFAFVNLHLLHDVSQFLCGLWLTASPVMYHYADKGQLRFWHGAAGIVIMFLAILNFRKDRRG